jgi:hypothetical protein
MARASIKENGIPEALHNSVIFPETPRCTVLATTTFKHLEGVVSRRDITGFLPQQ